MQMVDVMAIFLLFFAAAPGQACSPPRFWRPESFKDRLGQASIVFRGKVTSLPDQGASPIMYSPLYDATFEVDCYYKGIIDWGPKSETVGGFGWDGGLCTGSDVEVGKSYFIFADLYPWSDGLTVSHINMQSGATEETAGLIAEVEQDYGCSQPQR